MNNIVDKSAVKKTISKLSSGFNYNLKRTAIILSAGHGKRIKSTTSKMLHQIWGRPTVERVFNACTAGLNEFNSIIVVGIKALDVMEVFGKWTNNSFAYQEQQNGTGHAVQVGLMDIDAEKYDGTVLVFPGDMGLIDGETVKKFIEKFESSSEDMMVLTGLYEGKPENNSYGRIIRVKDTDANGNTSGTDFGKVIEIIEHKDILNLKEHDSYSLVFNGRTYSYSKKELLENNEFNSGVFAFDFKSLHKLIFQIENNNVQGEIYLTDMISLFNKNRLTVGAVSPVNQYVIMGFNDKTVLKQMNTIARNLVYSKIKNIVEIEDDKDFFLDDNVVEQILEADKNNTLLDMFIGKGVEVGKDVKINTHLTLMRGTKIRGAVIFGKNVKLLENVSLLSGNGQKIIIGNNSEILNGNIVEGNVSIGHNCKIESNVKLTGSSEFPLSIGNNVTVKGSSIINECLIADNVLIEHSVLIKKRINNDAVASTLKISFVVPSPEGDKAIEDII